MKDQDIGKLCKVLKYKGRNDLVDLIKHSRSVLNESSTFGSKWYSTLSKFEIYSPAKINKKIVGLSKIDREEIFKALLLIYPVKDNEPEITEIEYYPDFELEEEIELVEAQALNEIDFSYIQDQVKKCNDKIAERDYEGSITNSRTLLESMCLYIHEKLKGDYDYKGNLIRLYKDVSVLLNMTPADYPDGNLKQILSGVFSIINGVSGLRNDFSDAHGSSPTKTYKIDERHAILTVNLSKTIAEYLYLSFERNDNETIA